MEHSFAALSFDARQSRVQSILVAVAKRLPKRIRRNAHVMGALVRFVWARLNQGTRLTRAEVLQFADAMEAIVADTVPVHPDLASAANEYSQVA